MWAGFAISAAALVATLWNVRFEELGRALSTARLWWLLPASVFLAVSLLARAWRWSLLMGKTSFVAALHAQNIGYMLNATLPFRVGEVARAYVIGAKTSTGMARALSSVIVERVLDLASVVAMFAGFAQYVPMPPAFSRAATIGGVLVIAIIVGGAVLVWKKEAAEARLVAPFLSRISPRLATRLLPKFREVTEGFRVVGSVRRMALTGVLTVLVWGSAIAFAYFLMCAFLPGHMDQAGLVVVTGNLGGALPSAPGGLGVVQGFAKSALVVPFHVDEDRALAFVLVWSLGQQLLVIVLGLASLARIGMTFAEVRKGKATAP